MIGAICTATSLQGRSPAKRCKWLQNGELRTRKARCGGATPGGRLGSTRGRRIAQVSKSKGPGR